MSKTPIRSDLELLIRDSLERAGLRVDIEAYSQLAIWLEAVLGHHRNLTSVTEPAAAVAKHIVEPIAGFEAVLQADIAVPHGPIVDVGSGNGAPGLPIALAQPDRDVTLLDSREVSVEFLRTLPELLQLDRISVHHSRAELAGGLRERFAVALTRAVAPARIALELAVPLIAIGGVAIAFARPPAERGELELTAEALGATIMPLEANLELIAAVKLRATPERFPRRWTQIKRGPIDSA